jgi:hypothetical protein
MDAKFLFIGLLLLGTLLLVFGVSAALLAPLNFYSSKSVILGSKLIPIAAGASSDFDFSRVIKHEKQVEVIIEDGPFGYNSTWGNCYWINNPFQIALLDESKENFVNTATNHAPRVEHYFDIPSAWNDLGGIRISNPESFPVSVLVTVVFHNEIVNETWQGLFFLGVASIFLGILVIGATLVYFRKRKGLIEVVESGLKKPKEGSIEQQETLEKDTIAFLIVLGFVSLVVSFGFFSPAIGWFISRYGAGFAQALAVIIVYIAGSYVYIHGKNLKWARRLGLTIIILETLWLIYFLIVLIMFLFAVTPI